MPRAGAMYRDEGSGQVSLREQESAYRPASEPKPTAVGGDDDMTPEVLFRKEHVRLCRTVALLVGDRNVAQEVVQDAFAAVIANWGRIDPARATAYLYRCAINGGRSILRLRKPIRSCRWDRPTDGPAADSAVLLSERDRDLWESVNRLPSRQRQAIILRFYSDLSISQVAEILHVAPTAVATATNHALKKLRVDGSRWTS